MLELRITYLFKVKYLIYYAPATILSNTILFYFLHDV